jgi:hypothetical protein
MQAQEADMRRQQEEAIASALAEIEIVKQAALASAAAAEAARIQETTDRVAKQKQLDDEYTAKRQQAHAEQQAQYEQEQRAAAEALRLQREAEQAELNEVSHCVHPSIMYRYA